MRQIVLLIAAVFLLSACSSVESTTTTSEPMAVSLVARDIAYDTVEIEATVGQPVRLTLENQGVLEHDFNIVELPLSGEVTMTESAGGMAGHDMGHHDMGHMESEPEVHVAASAGGESTVVFIPDAPGEYEFYCAVAGHREAGMVGKLIVKEY